MKFPVDIIGVMSGTSLDGLDLCYTRFNCEGGKYSFKIIKAVTLPYEAKMLSDLQNCRSLTNNDLIELHNHWGSYVGKAINSHFIAQELIPDCISTHGHTVFHEPAAGYSLQIGSMENIASISNCMVIGDFRQLDVSKGGQGAPLVPIGDLHLFSEFNYCLNLGGIANVSFVEEGAMKAFDICPCNLVLNAYARKKGFDYDDAGHLAAAGAVNQALLSDLNALNYYQVKPRPSLGIEIIEFVFLPVLEKHTLSVEDVLCTFCHHIALQLASIIKRNQTVLCTGGGAYNKFLLQCFKDAGITIVVPDQEIIEFKEAVVFAFLALRKLENKVNVLKSVTGAKENSISGVVVQVSDLS